MNFNKKQPIFNLENFFKSYESRIPLKIIFNLLHIDDILTLASCSSSLYDTIWLLYNDQAFKEFNIEKFDESPIIDISAKEKLFTILACDDEFYDRTVKVNCDFHKKYFIKLDIEAKLKTIKTISKNCKLSHKIIRNGCEEEIYINKKGDKFRCLYFDKVKDKWKDSDNICYDNVLEYQKNNEIIMQIGTTCCHPFLYLPPYRWGQADGSSEYFPSVPVNLPYYEDDFKYLDPNYKYEYNVDNEDKENTD